MCPVVFLALILSFVMLLLELTAALNVSFSTNSLHLKEDEERAVYYAINDNDLVAQDGLHRFVAVVENELIAEVANYTQYLNKSSGIVDGTIIVRGKFLGVTKLRVSRAKNGTKEYSESVELRVLKRQRAITKAFTVCVIVLVSLNYINMGCALDLNVVKSVLKKPIAPSVGFFCQYVIMPLISYGVGKLLFTDVAYQLALFTFGCSPGGGASNMWTVLLKGNLNLSLTMTFVTGLAALGMVPFWLFTLGRTLFSDMNTIVPYKQILQTLVIMMITLGIGLLFQRYLPRVAKFCRRILSPVSIAMILFIIVFGTYANWYMFKLFTWQIVVAATTNVWLGFVFGALCSVFWHLPVEDIIAISIETGVQNTGVSFVLIQYALYPPESDLASVVPVAASIMTPIPLLVCYCIQKIRGHTFSRSHKEVSQLDDERRALPAQNSAESIGSKANGYVY